MSTFHDWQYYAAGLPRWDFRLTEPSLWNPFHDKDDTMSAANSSYSGRPSLSRFAASKLVRIVINKDVILVDENQLDYWSENWRNIMVLQRDGSRGYAYWVYTGCETSVFRCLQQWLHEQKLPTEESINEAGYSPQDEEEQNENKDEDRDEKKQPDKEGEEGSSSGKITEPLTCRMAVELYFVAWNLDMPQLMDDALTVLFDHYLRVKQIPSRGMVHRVFDNAYPIGQHIHYLFADLYLKFGVVDCSALAWAGEDVKKWPWGFLQLFLGRCRMLGLNQGIPSDGMGVLCEELKSVTGESVPRSGLINRLCDYHHHAGCSGVRQPRRGRCEYLKIRRVE